MNLEQYKSRHGISMFIGTPCRRAVQGLISQLDVLSRQVSLLFLTL